METILEQLSMQLRQRTVLTTTYAFFFKCGPVLLRGTKCATEEGKCVVLLLADGLAQLVIWALRSDCRPKRVAGIGVYAES